MYERFFGLEDEPFRLTPDPRYLFLSPKHAEALAHLRLGLTESSGFVCITGEVGTGKTTLLRTFLRELGPEVAAAYTLTPPRSALELLRRVAREFGLSASSQNEIELIEELHAHLLAQREAGRISVLVLDEAQALPTGLLEQIRLLLNLETATDKLLRIVLVGQPELRALLLDPRLAQLNQRITLRWHLGPLSYRETVAYVAHRLAVAGRGAAHLFTRPALRLLHSVSGGVPRLVNMVAHRALLAAFVAREPRVTRSLVAVAYREIQTVPLPGTMSPARKAAWAVAGLAVGVTVVTLGARPLDGLFDALARAPGGGDARSARDAGPAPAPVAPAAPVSAAAPAAPSPRATASSPADLAQSLASVDRQASARAATDAVLAAWGERPLAPEEVSVPASLDSIAWRRGLQELPLAANRSMLRLLDLPVVLVLSVPGTPEPCYAALTAMDASRAVLSIGGVPVTVEGDVFERFWSGQAHVLWRDFAGLGPVLRRGTKGVGVMRLQGLLGRAGTYDGEPTGLFDGATESSVVGFQRSHLLDPDGLVGPLTRIVLYAAAGGYVRPTLAIGQGTAS